MTAGLELKQFNRLVCKLKPYVHLQQEGSVALDLAFAFIL